MGYCEFKIPFFIEGVYVKTAEMAKGAEIHEEAERTERETAVTVPLTRVKLEDTREDLDFIREDVMTRFTHEFASSDGKALLTLFGRADKVMRHNETLIISDDKNTARPGRHDTLSEPYAGQLLQVLAYLHSDYNLGESLGGWTGIPHEHKMYRVNIIDSRTRKIYKTYEDTVGKRHAGMLFDNASKFAQKCLEWNELVHHNSVQKCRACGFFENCNKALR